MLAQRAVACNDNNASIIVNAADETLNDEYYVLRETYFLRVPSTAWVGSLYMSVSFLLGPVAANLCDRYGCRITAMLGSITCVLGLLLTSQAPSIFCMYLTYSVIVGFGTCCIYTASFVVVPRYFLKRRALATGVVSCGPAGGSLVMGPLLQLLLDTLGWRNTFIAMAGMASLICVLALLYDPRTAKEISASSSDGVREAPQHKSSESQSSWYSNIFTNPALVIWSVSCAVAFLGLYNPQVLLVNCFITYIQGFIKSIHRIFNFCLPQYLF